MVDKLLKHFIIEENNGGNIKIKTSRQKDSNVEGANSKDFTNTFQDETKNLIKDFRNIHNYLYANEGLTPLDSFKEFLNLLFLKIIVFEKDNEINISEKEFVLDVNASFDKVKDKYRNLFNSNDQIHLPKSAITFVLNHLKKYNFDSITNDVKGLAFQNFLRSQFRVDRGQFLTPDPIIQLIVNFLDPKEGDKIIDPACGTGGFLIYSKRYNKAISDTTFGIEIDNFISRVAKMRLILEDGNMKNIINLNSLKDILVSKSEFIGTYDIVMTNPPFGSQGKIANKNILMNFDLGYKWKDIDGSFVKTQDLQTGQIPDVLFIELCLKLLKEEGRLGIVLPEGIFENSTFQYVREYIKKQAQIIAVISLPISTFFPFGTGVKTSILFLKKFSANQVKDLKNFDYKIFFGVIENIGYIANKNATPDYVKNKDGSLKKDSNGNFVINEDYSELTEQFKRFQKEQAIEKKPFISLMRYSDINDRINANFYLQKYIEIDDKLKSLNAVPLSSVVNIISTKAKILKNKSAKISYIEISDINPIFGEIVKSEELFVHEAPSRASYEIKESDIVTAVSGISTGTKMHATAYVTKEFDGSICTNGLRVLRTKTIDPFYLFAFCKSNLFLNQVFRHRTGAAIPAISDNDLAKILIPIPGLEKKLIVENEIKEFHKFKKLSKTHLERAIESINELQQ